MPNYRGHLLGGGIFYAAALGAATYGVMPLAATPYELVLWLGMCLLGALFPDIDIHSKGQKILYRTLLVGVLVSIALARWTLFCVLGAMAVFPLLMTHRGLTHTVRFVLVAPLLIPIGIKAYLPHYFGRSFYVYAFFVLGALSHLILDYGPKRFMKRTLGRGR